jgi:hypothetical protein
VRLLTLTLTLLLAAAIATSAFAEEQPEENTVTLDVKDEDVVVILKSMQKQCGIRNLLIDKDVTGKGMVYFNEVPCSTAFKTVLSQFGLAGTVEPNIVHVETRSH